MIVITFSDRPPPQKKKKQPQKTTTTKTDTFKIYVN